MHKIYLSLISKVLLIGFLVFLVIGTGVIIVFSAENTVHTQYTPPSMNLIQTESSASPAPGLPAILPRTNVTPAFTIEDAKQYVETHYLGSAFPAASKAIIVMALFMTDQKLNTILKGESTGRPPNTLLCYVELHGAFSFPAPQGKKVTYYTGFEVFDAHTGNLLMAGGF